MKFYTLSIADAEHGHMLCDLETDLNNIIIKWVGMFRHRCSSLNGWAKDGDDPLKIIPDMWRDQIIDEAISPSHTRGSGGAMFASHMRRTITRGLDKLGYDADFDFWGPVMWEIHTHNL